MPMYNLIEYSYNYSKISGPLWQYYRDKRNANLVDSESLKSKIKIAGTTPADGNTKDVKIAVPLRYLSNFWTTLEITLINFEINLILTWSSTYAITNSTGAVTFTITDTKLYVPVVTLLTQDSVKLLDQLKSEFKRTINWNKLSVKSFDRKTKPILDYLVDPSFQGVNRLFLLSFEGNAYQTRHGI